MTIIILPPTHLISFFLNRLVIPEIKILLDFLSLKTDGNKADLIARLMAYLAKPIDNGVVRIAPPSLSLSLSLSLLSLPKPIDS